MLLSSEIFCHLPKKPVSNVPKLTVRYNKVYKNNNFITIHEFSAYVDAVFIEESFVESYYDWGLALKIQMSR